MNTILEPHFDHIMNYHLDLLEAFLSALCPVLPSPPLFPPVPPLLPCDWAKMRLGRGGGVGCLGGGGLSREAFTQRKEKGGGAQIMQGDSTGVIRANKLSAWASDGPYCSYLDGGTMAGCQAPIVHNLLMLTKCQCDP